MFASYWLLELLVLISVLIFLAENCTFVAGCSRPLGRGPWWFLQKIRHNEGQLLRIGKLDIDHWRRLISLKQWANDWLTNCSYFTGCRSLRTATAKTQWGNGTPTWRWLTTNAWATPDHLALPSFTWWACSSDTRSECRCNNSKSTCSATHLSTKVSTCLDPSRRGQWYPSTTMPTSITPTDSLLPAGTTITLNLTTHKKWCSEE